MPPIIHLLAFGEPSTRAGVVSVPRYRIRYRNRHRALILLYHLGMADRVARMHQTTVRFGEELWSQLENEARRTGVSAAQYVRDATLARLAYTAGQRGDALFPDHPAPGAAQAENARVHARGAVSDSSAVWAQARLARERARIVRDDARATQMQSAKSRVGRRFDSEVEGR
jgi:hypothetical protein